VGPRKAAASNLQRLEPDNAAAWALSLDASTDDSDALRRAATGTRFDSHKSALIKLWLDAAAAHPASAELAESMRKTQPGHDSPELDAALSTAMTMGFSAELDTAPLAVVRRCAAKDKVVKAEDREPCIAIARTMLRSGTSMLSAMFGDTVLRKLDAREPADEARTTDLKKEQGAMRAYDARALSTFVNAYASTGSEIEAMRIASGAAGSATTANPR
jgi:hypothetical protein